MAQGNGAAMVRRGVFTAVLGLGIALTATIAAGAHQPTATSAGAVVNPTDWNNIAVGGPGVGHPVL